MVVEFSVSGETAADLLDEARRVLARFSPGSSIADATIEASPLLRRADSQIPTMWEGRVVVKVQ